MVRRMIKEHDSDLANVGVGVEIITLVKNLDIRLANIEQTMGEVSKALQDQPIAKEWYSTHELAEAMGVSVFTVAERWCNTGRIEAKKVPGSKKWRIPGHEYRRLVAGGSLRAGSK